MIQLNSVNLLIFYFSEFHINIIFQFMAYFPKCGLALKFLEKMLDTFHYPRHKLHGLNISSSFI